MTLILTALTPKHIVQVSDRRVVRVGPSGEIQKTEDERIKAIITPWFACSYSGPAELGNNDTAEWLALQLSDHICKSDGGISHLGPAIQQQATLQNVRNQPFSMVCAGWFGKDERKPLAFVISNVDHRDGHPLNKFQTIQFSIKEGAVSVVMATGVPLTRSEYDNVNRTIQNICKGDSATARAIAKILAQCVWSIARSPKRKTYVSEEVLISSLPLLKPRSLPMVVGKLVEEFWSVTCVKAREGVELPGGPIIVGNKAAIQALLPEKPPRPGISTGAKIIRMPERGSITAIILTDPPLGEAWGWPGMSPGESLCEPHE